MPIKWVARLLFILGMVVYLPSLNGQWLYDDWQFIVDNVHIQEMNISSIFSENTTAGAGRITNYYRPLTSLTFAIDYQLWGKNPVGFHVTNALLHALAGVVLFLLLYELGMGKWAGAGIAAIFLTHPLQVEAVAYVNSRGDSLYAVLLFLGLLTFAKSTKESYKLQVTSFKNQNAKIKTQNDNVKVKNSSYSILHTKYLILSVIFYALAILAKEIAVAGIGLYVLIYFLNQTSKIIKQSDKSKIKNKDPKTNSYKLTAISFKDTLYFRDRQTLLTFLGLTATLATYLYLRLTSLNFANSLDFGAFKGVYSESIWVRLLTFSNVFLTYIRLMLIPYPLFYERTAPIITSPNLTSFVTCSLIMGALLLGYWEWRRYRTVWIWFSWLWFLGMLVPVSGLVPINGLVYEHWLYVPMIGFFLFSYRLITLIYWEVVKHGIGNHRNTKIHKSTESKEGRLVKIIESQRFSISLLVILITGYTLLSWRQEWIWGEPFRFYEYTLKYTQTERLYNNYGWVYTQIKDYDSAEKYLLKAIEIGDTIPQVRANLAGVYWEQGRIEEAIAEYKRTIALEPSHYPSYKMLITIFIQNHRLPEALEWTQKLVDTDNGNWEYHFMLGKVAYLSYRDEQAEAEFLKAMRLAGNVAHVQSLVNQLKEQSR